MRWGPLLAVLTLLLSSCAYPSSATPASSTTTTTSAAPPTVGASNPTKTTTIPTTTTVVTATTTTVPSLPLAGEYPPLPRAASGFGEVLPTPQELVDRRFATPERLAPPPDGSFHATVGAVPHEVAARSTWDPGCPVGLEELAYLTISHWGFDGLPHTGEMIVHDSVAEQVVAVFEEMHEARFPIEEMRVIAAWELDEPPTGAGNITTSFVCRNVVGGGNWSEHAYGLAIDLNPFHNPYSKGEIVLPELASAYLDREWERPGMVVAGDPVVEAFGEIGWRWGGEWRSLKDWMHFSLRGR